MKKARIIPLIFFIILSIQPFLAADDDPFAVKRAFFSNESLDYQDTAGRTPLMKALRRRDDSTAVLLLNAGALTDLTDKNGQTALYYALQFSENEELLKLLLDTILSQNGDLNRRDRRGRTALELFIARGRNSAFLTLLGEAGVQALPSSRGGNLLFSALEREDPFKSEVLEELVWIGYSINDTNSQKRTVLEEAFFREDSNSAALLERIKDSLSDELIHSLYFSGSELTLSQVEERLVRGASPSYRSEQGFTPCHYAVAAGRPDILMVLLDWEDEKNPFEDDSRDLQELLMFFPLDYDIETALPLMRILLNENLPVNIRNEEGITLLNASLHHSEDLASLLLEHGADPLQRNPGGVSPLMNALTMILREDGTILEELAAAGAELDIRDDKGSDILSYAVLYGQGTPIIKKLLALGVDAESRDDFGTPGFFWAAAFSTDKELIAYLLSEKERYLWRDKDGWTALMGALNFGNSPEIVEELAGFYNDGRMGDGTGRNLMQFRERYRQYYGDSHLPALENLIRKRIYPALSVPYECDPDTELRNILEFGSDPEMIDLLIQEGANPAAYYSDGFTPLITAVAFNSYEMTVSILASGAPVFDTTPYGWTPLHVASWQSDPGTARLLMDRGWDVNVRDFEHWTPLHWAARNGAAPEYLNLLFERGADPQSITYRKDSALHLACSAWVPPGAESLKILLDRGVAVDAVNVLGETALMLAAGLGYTDACNTLLAAGADPALKDAQGVTASSKAYESGHYGLARSLFDAENK